MRSKQFRIWSALGAFAILAVAAVSFALARGDAGSAEGSHLPGSQLRRAGTEGAEVSEYQRLILEDGEVTDGEMEGAVRETVACLRAQGLNAEFLPQEVAWAPPTFRVISATEPIGMAEATVPCKTQYMSELGETFAVNRAPKNAAFGADEHIQRVETCLADQGFPLNGRYENSWHYARQAELSAEPGGTAAWEFCAQRVQAERYPSQ